MKNLLIFIISIVSIYTVKAQGKEITGAPANIYRQAYPKTNELVHTKLQVKFDFSKAWMYGKAWITLQPHFYATDTLTLDAKGMDIKEVAIAKGNTTTTLKYTYDSTQLFIKLDKVYSAKEKYTIYISYVSRPNDLKSAGSAAITDSKGLYFINPAGTDKDKPTQIWTQGETEANSVWMPTIDKPN
ncbi:MAG: M1 family peptidase, partial [Ferruginibacter sp.]